MKKTLELVIVIGYIIVFSVGCGSDATNPQVTPTPTTIPYTVTLTPEAEKMPSKEGHNLGINNFAEKMLRGTTLKYEMVGYDYDDMTGFDISEFVRWNASARVTFSYGSQMDHVTIVAQSGSSDIDTDIAAQNEITSFLFDLMCKAVEIDKYNSYEKNSIRDETSYRGFNEEIIWCLRGDSKGIVGRYLEYPYTCMVGFTSSGWFCSITIWLDEAAKVNVPENYISLLSIKGNTSEKNNKENTPTPTKAATYTPTPTTRGENMATPVPTKVPTATPVVINTPTPIAESTPTPTPKPTDMPIPTPEPTNTPTPTLAPTSTLTPTPLPEYVTFSEAQILEMVSNDGWQGNVFWSSGSYEYHDGSNYKTMKLTVKPSNIDVMFQNTSKLVIEFGGQVVGVWPQEYHDGGHSYTVEGNRIIISSAKHIVDSWISVAFVDDNEENYRIKSITIYTK